MPTNNSNNIEWRYQLIATTFNDEIEYGVYEVSYDPETGEIIYVATPEPMQLTGESPEGILAMLREIHDDVKSYGPLMAEDIRVKIPPKGTEDALDNLRYDDDPDSLDESESMEIYDGDNETERYAVERMYDDTDTDGNVLDLMEFMEKGK